MDRWQGKVAVITGASSGIGKEAAQKFVENGLTVVGIARRVEIVEALAKDLAGKPGKLFAFKCDVSNEDEVKEVFDKIKITVGPIAILINNAGIVINSTFIDGNPKDWKQVLDINLYGTMICAHEAIKQMREVDDCGHIININSVAGHKIMDLNPNITNAYSSSKHGVTVFTEVLRQELRNNNSKIKVTSISPGLVDTDIFQAGKVTGLTKEVITQRPYLKSEDVVDAMVYALSTKPHVLVNEIIIKPMGENF